MNKLQNIQALRGIAVLSVLLFHLGVIEKKYGGSNTLLPDWLQFGMFGVDLFFVISGFVMVTVTRGKFGQMKSALLFLYHRVSRIYPLYWAYTTLALLVFIVQPSWVNNSQGNQVDILSSYLLFPGRLLPLVQVGWTLIHEVYFYVVFFLLLLLPEKFFVPALFLWGVGIAVSGFPVVPPLTRLVLHPLTFEFIAGCLLAVHYHNFRPVKVNGNVLVAIAGLGLAAAVVGYIQYHRATGASPLEFDEALYYGIPAVVIVFCITHAERNGVTLPGFLIQLGNISYSIYLSHLFTVNVVGRIWGGFATDSLLDNAIALTLAFALALAVGYASYRILELPLLKLTRKIA